MVNSKRYAAFFSMLRIGLMTHFSSFERVWVNQSTQKMILVSFVTSQCNSFKLSFSFKLQMMSLKQFQRAEVLSIKSQEHRARSGCFHVPRLSGRNVLGMSKNIFNLPRHQTSEAETSSRKSAFENKVLALLFHLLEKNDERSWSWSSGSAATPSSQWFVRQRGHFCWFRSKFVSRTFFFNLALPFEKVFFPPEEK